MNHNSISKDANKAVELFLETCDDRNQANLKDLSSLCEKARVIYTKRTKI